MKKLKVWLLTLISVMAIVCCLAGCGSKAGTYKFDSMTGKSGAISIEVKAGEKYNGVTISEDYMTVTLNDDGTVVSTTKATGTEVKSEGTWKENADDKNKIDITSAGVTTTVSCDGSTITMETMGMTVTLKK